MSIEYKKSITLTKDSTIYGHQGLDSAGFPKDAGNAKLSQVLDLSEDQTTESLKTRITITVDSANELLYHFNIDGDSVATFTVPSDRFLKSVSYDASTNMLIFTFVTQEGESTVSVDMSSLVDTYTAGDGLKLDNSVFSVNVKGSETRLKASADGLSIDLTDVIALIDTERTQRQNTYADLDARIVTIENKTSAIDNAITTCNTKANEAASSASLASGYATTASEKATDASNSATQASNYRTDAWSYRDEAKGFSLMAERWASYPEDSLVFDSKYSALHYSEKAKGYMDTASTKATEASTKATEASTSANQAKGYRDEAKGYRDEINPSLLATKTEVQNAVNEVMKTLYPVGSIYLSLVKQDPGTWIAGTRWSLIDSGYALWTTTANDAGSPIPAGLPNIKGYIQSNSWALGGNDSDTTSQGALKGEDYTKNTSKGVSSSAVYMSKISFDASNSTAIYGKSYTVQPPAMKIYAYRREIDS